MFINDFFKAGVTESKQAVSDYDTWRDQVAAAGGEVHTQKDRVRLVAQSWDGDTIGEFNLKHNQGWFNGEKGGQQGVTEGKDKGEKVLHHFANVVADEYFYDVDQVIHNMGEDLITPSGVLVYSFTDDSITYLMGVLGPNKPSPLVSVSNAGGGEYNELEISIGERVVYAVTYGKNGPILTTVKGKKIAKANPRQDEWDLVGIALDLLWGKMLHKFMEQGVAEGKGDFAQAIENLHGWHEVESSNPDIRIWEFDDREGGHYAQGTVYYIEKTGRIQIEFEDHDGYHGGDVTDAFDSIGDAMNVLKNITVQVRPNTGKARDFDKLGGRTVAGPDDLYKTDRVGRKGTLNKTRMDIMKASSPYRKTGPEGQLPESGVAEATGDPKFDKMLKGITGKRQVAKQQKADTKQQARDAFGSMFGGGNPADKLSIRKKGVAEVSDDGYGYKSLSTEQIMKLIKSGNWEAIQDVVPGKHIQLRNNRNGKSKTIHVKRDMAEGGELPPNVVDMIKKIAQSTAAPEHKKAMINALIAKYRDSAMAETYGGQLHTKHKKNRFKQIKKIKRQKKPFGLSDLSEEGCNMTQEGRGCPMHGLQECPGYQMIETSAQDKLHQHHQEIRKKSGLPHPDHYLKMMKQKQAEIDALRSEIAADKAKGLGEARKPDYNFDIEDIKKLEKIRDLSTLKTVAFELISKPSAKPMKPEKVEWFRSALERMDSPLKVIKLMYDLMLSGEGHQVIGSRNSMKANSYRGRFSEQEDITEDVERYVEALARAGYEVNEEKVRLDPKCWKGKKIGNPKTKMKGGVRVNNCVPK